MVKLQYAITKGGNQTHLAHEGEKVTLCSKQIASVLPDDTYKFMCATCLTVKERL